MSEIIWYLSFSDWRVSLSIMISPCCVVIAKGKAGRGLAMVGKGGENGVKRRLFACGDGHLMQCAD